MSIQIKSSAELFAALPSMMGFVPSECIIPITFSDGGRVHHIMRLALDSPQEAFDRVKEVAAADTAVAGMIIITVGPQPGTDEYNMDVLVNMLPEPIMETMCNSDDVILYALPAFHAGVPILAINHENGDLGVIGTLPEWKDAECTAEHVMVAGSTVAGSEQEMVEMFLPDDEADEYIGTDVMAWVESGFENELRPTNTMVGEYISADKGNRDAILGKMVPHFGKAMSEFAAVSRGTTGLARTEALTVAGMAAYCWGRGAHANIAFAMAKREAHERDDDAVLATLASTMLGHGVHPEEIRQVCLKLIEGHQN